MPPGAAAGVVVTAAVVAAGAAGYRSRRSDEVRKAAGVAVHVAWDRVAPAGRGETHAGRLAAAAAFARRSAAREVAPRARSDLVARVRWGRTVEGGIRRVAVKLRLSRGGVGSSGALGHTATLRAPRRCTVFVLDASLASVRESHPFRAGPPFTLRPGEDPYVRFTGADRPSLFAFRAGPIRRACNAASCGKTGCDSSRCDPWVDCTRPLADPAGEAAYWCNLGTSTGGTRPARGDYGPVTASGGDRLVDRRRAPEPLARSAAWINDTIGSVARRAVSHDLFLTVAADARILDVRPRGGFGRGVDGGAPAGVEGLVDAGWYPLLRPRSMTFDESSAVALASRRVTSGACRHADARNIVVVGPDPVPARPYLPPPSGTVLVRTSAGAAGETRRKLFGDLPIRESDPSERGPD